MTDRINALTVVLEKDMREDDVESLCQAIQHMRNVIQVDVHVSDITSLVAESRVRRELGLKLMDVLKRDK